MLVNSHRALFIMYVTLTMLELLSRYCANPLYSFRVCWTRMTIICLLPALYAGLIRNPVSRNQVYLLQDNNIASNSTDDCEYLFNAVQSWLHSSATIQTYYKLIDDEDRDAHLLWAQVLPVRCSWQHENGVITICNSLRSVATIAPICAYWDNTMSTNPSKEYFADSLASRPGGILEVALQDIAPSNFVDNETQSEFYVRAFYNEAHPIALA